MRISFITTVFNEEKSISNFLRSIAVQTKQPDEIIIVDGGSTDATLSILEHVIARSKTTKQSLKKVKIQILQKKGNRSVGRNEAIKQATGDIIACSDAGNILDKKWLENITKPFKDSRLCGNDRGDEVDVVAGYYKGRSENIFQKCLIPYILVMPDKVDPDNFLPATRSIAFRKSIWEKAGKFSEEYSHNEDYIFANQLKKIKAKIIFEKDAIVYWLPRKTFKEAFIMFFRFALGDIEAKILRTKVLLLFARYFLGSYFIFLSLLYKAYFMLNTLYLILFIYLCWAIWKNYHYIDDYRAIYLLPAIQLTADAAVLFGSVIGLLKNIIRFNYVFYIKQNKFLVFVLIIYSSILLLTIKWGIPNQNHPFPYHMDEWHQLQAVANTFRYGTPNTAGSANGTMFHFLLSGFYLLPFMLFQIINPFELQIDNWIARENIFIVLRLQTIIFGALSIFVLYKITQLINAPKKLTITLFTFTPIWLMLSGYFKYDIALIFWILLSLLFFFKFAKNPSNKNFLLASIPAGLAVAVKISAFPLFPIYILSYFLFYPGSNVIARLRSGEAIPSSIARKYINPFKFLLIGIFIFSSIIIIFGMPDTLFGKGNILLYLYENIIQGPPTTSNFNLGMRPLIYLFTKHYSIIFGLGLLLLFALSCLFWLIKLFKSVIARRTVYPEQSRREAFSYKAKNLLFLFLSLFIFIASIIPLQIYGGGNRSLILLPFLTLIISLAWHESSWKVAEWTPSRWTLAFRKILIILLLIIILTFQIFTSLIWVTMKINDSPQEKASIWIQKNIPQNATIGLENVPIYQNIPDIIQKEFYFNQYNIKGENKYKYQIVDFQGKSLPEYIVITNAEIESKISKVSAKRDLLNRMQKENYKKLASFYPKLIRYLPFINDTDYYFSWLGTSPLTTSVYKK